MGAFTLTIANGGSILVDTAQKFSGTRSLHVQSMGGATAMLRFTQQFPFNAEFGRLMIYMPVKPTVGQHWDILQSQSGVGDQWELGGFSGQFFMAVDPPDNGMRSQTAFPQSNAWHCIQWNFQNNMFSAKLDGAFVTPTPIVDRWTNGTAWRNLIVGFQIFGATDPVDYWLDDLAFGEQEIRCPGP
jgi:hypothetical protein